MAANGNKWTEISSDEQDEETKHVEEVKKVPERDDNEDNQQKFGRNFQNQNQQKKAPIQHRSEIEELIDSNRQEEIVLNIVKCHFDATESDIVSTFSDFKFVNIENYNKGSFSLVFENKSEAKRFVQSTRNLKILDRNFWVKFPTMHQKGNGRIEGVENNNEKISNQDRFSRKDYDAPKKNRDNYNRKEHNENQNGEVVSTQKQFFRSDEKRGQRPVNVPEQKPYKPQPKQAEEDEGWSTVGINQKPLDLKPRQKYGGGYNKTQTQRPQYQK